MIDYRCGEHSMCGDTDGPSHANASIEPKDSNIDWIKWKNRNAIEPIRIRFDLF